MKDTKPTPKAEHHYFCSSSSSFAWDNSLLACLTRIADEDSQYEFISGCNVWRVPGDESVEYSIQYFAPQIEGAEYIGFTPYKGKDNA